ncbi:hypothetical protein TB2_024368 [Malus domestica]
MLYKNFQKLDLLGLHQFKLKYGQWIWRTVTSLISIAQPGSGKKLALQSLESEVGRVFGDREDFGTLSAVP